jgi:hypothetical protein
VDNEIMIVYPGEPWHADETDDCVRVFRGHLQMIKMPKRDTPYEEYWMSGADLEWLLSVLNSAESQDQGLPHSAPIKENEA